MSSPADKQATSRFTNRVEYYVRSRPGYPALVLDLIEESWGALKATRLADIGSGTGILSALLLDRGAEVIGIEPNAAMRQCGDDLLRARTGFRSQAGTAENTGLADHSVDGIAAAQAFHWFDPPRARAEFARILKPGGFVALLWNTRLTTGNAFLMAFDRFLRQFSIDFDKVNHSEVAGEAVVRSFFAPNTCLYAAFPHHQLFNFEGLLSRVLSSSFMPDEQHPSFPAMRAALEELYQAHAQHGWVAWEYKAEMYFGRLDPAVAG